MLKKNSKTLANRLQPFLFLWIRLEYKLVLYKVGVSWTMCLWPLKLWNRLKKENKTSSWFSQILKNHMTINWIFSKKHDKTWLFISMD